jgi:hypothetical protein
MDPHQNHQKPEIQKADWLANSLGAEIFISTYAGFCFVFGS